MTNWSEITPYLNYGVLGLVVLGIFFGWIWPKPSVDRLVEEIKRLIEEKEKAERMRDEALATAQEKILPILTTFSASVDTIKPLLQEIVRDWNRDEHRRHRN